MVEMFMIGEHESCSRPTILFSCKNGSRRQTAIIIVKEAEILAPYPGIVMAECSRMPKLLGGDRIADLNLEPGVYQDKKLGWPDVSILVVGKPAECPPRRATMGGIIRIGVKLYGLTTKHAFLPAPCPHADDESDDDFAFFEEPDLRTGKEDQLFADITKPR